MTATRVQAFIGRRFYRSRHGAVATLERFSTRLRDEVKLGTLTNQLLVGVALTIQPAHMPVSSTHRVEAAR